MGLHQAEAIVLRRSPFRETSAIVTCVTDRWGKLRGLIKGLWGRSPKYRSVMAPLTINRIVFYDTRQSVLHLITQCDLLEPLSGLERDLEIMRGAALVAELVDVLLEPDAPQPDAFALVKTTLRRLAAHGPERATGACVEYIMRLLRVVGFHPQVDECTGCGQHPAGGALWSARQGGLLCPGCLHEDPAAQPLAPWLLEAFVRCAESDEAMGVSPSQAEAMLPHLEEFLHWRLPRPLRTLKGLGIGTGGRGPIAVASEG